MLEEVFYLTPHNLGYVALLAPSVLLQVQAIPKTLDKTAFEARDTVAQRTHTMGTSRQDSPRGSQHLAVPVLVLAGPCNGSQVVKERGSP